MKKVSGQYQDEYYLDCGLKLDGSHISMGLGVSADGDLVEGYSSPLTTGSALTSFSFEQRIEIAEFAIRRLQAFIELCNERSALKDRGEEIDWREVDLDKQPMHGSRQA